MLIESAMADKNVTQGMMMARVESMEINLPVDLDDLIEEKEESFFQYEDMNDEVNLLKELEELEDLEDLAEVESVKPMIAYMPRDESMFRVEDREDEEALERMMQI